MSDFLSNLLNRHLGLGEMVLPRGLGRFEPDKNVAATFFPAQAQADSSHLRSEGAKPMKDPAEMYRADQSSANKPASDQREPTVRSVPVAEEEIIEQTLGNASPQYAYRPIQNASDPADPRFSTTVGLSNDSVRPNDTGFPYRAANRENKTINGSVATMEHTLKPSPAFGVQGYSTTSDKSNNPIPTVPNTTAKGVNLLRSDRHQTPTSKLPTDLSPTLTEEPPVITESQHDKVTLHHTHSSSQSLLEVPASLSQRQIELPEELSMRGRKDERESVVNVTIGRIEVRAVMQQTPPPPRRKSSPKPKMSLDDYLKQRSGGK